MHKFSPKDLRTHAIVAVTITLALFFIDEGYYDFRWMKSIANWICFLIYSGALFGGQVLVRKLLFRKAENTHIVLSCILGATIGFLFVIGIIFRNWTH